MSFSYNFGANPAIDIPRLLFSDAVEYAVASPTIRVCIFEDEEIATFTTIVASCYISGPGGTLATLTTAVSYFRIAALMCDSLACNKSRLDLTKLQDANTDFHGSAKALREQAERFRQIDNEQVACAWIEQCFTSFARRDRVENQLWRQVS